MKAVRAANQGKSKNKNKDTPSKTSKAAERKNAKIAAKEAREAAKKAEEDELGDGIGTLDDKVHEMYSVDQGAEQEENAEARAKMKKRLADTQAQLDEIRAKDGTGAMPKKSKPLSFRWNLLKTSLLPNIGQHPTPRSGHTAWTIAPDDPRIFIHGGAGAADDRGVTDKDVEHIYSLNTESLKWNISHTYKKPRHRTYHTVTVVGPNTKLPEHLQIPRLICFGGYNQGSIDHDNYALIKWSEFLAGNSYMRIPPPGLPDTPKEIQGIKDVWQQLEKLHTGDIPLGRCNHTATLVGSSILVIFGGWHSDFVDDVYTLDVTSWRWTHRTPKLEALEQLHGGAVVAARRNERN